MKAVKANVEGLITTTAMNSITATVTNLIIFQGLQATFLTNTVGAVLMAKHFGDLLKKGTGGFGKAGKDPHKSILVNMSAKVGSITDNGKYR